MQRALENAVAEFTLCPALPNEAELPAFWARHGVPEADALELTRDLPRLLVYRTLVRGNLQGALSCTIPRTIARLGARFDRDFAEFLDAHPPSTHYLKDITPAFLEFALVRWARDPGVPAYLSDLARHEALQIEVASLEARPKDHVAAELSLAHGIEFIDAVRHVRYDYAVHRLSEDETNRDVPERTPVSLLVYRSPEHEVRYLELGPFASALLQGLLSEQLSLGNALTSAARNLGMELEDTLLSATARLLADLAERGALLGKTATSPPGE